MDLTKVGEYIFVPDNFLDADVAIVLGMNDWRRPVMRAVELYHERHVRRLLFTGGYNWKIKATEATETGQAGQAVSCAARRRPTSFHRALATPIPRWWTSPRRGGRPAPDPMFRRKAIPR